MGKKLEMYKWFSRFKNNKIVMDDKRHAQHPYKIENP